MNTAVAVIDVQKGMFTLPGVQPHLGGRMMDALNDVIAKARVSEVPIIFVQHDGGDGQPTQKGTEGFELADGLDSRQTDYFVTKTRCGAFHDTALQTTLNDLSVNTIIVGGMQTEFCVDTMIRTAIGLGYDIVTIEDGHSTFDTDNLDATEIISHHTRIWRQAFGTVVPAQDIEFS